MRIVSLLPSATEILFALGLDREIAGVTHECDFPARARTKTIVIHSRLPEDAPPAEIDRLVRDYASRGESLYSVDAEALQALSPDLIITQDLCHVCAASPDDLAATLAQFRRRPQVLCLNPQDLGDVWRDILLVGEETGRRAQAESLVRRIGAKLGEIQRAIETVIERPRVAFLEWLQPFYAGGHWVPEMISLAGGQDVFGSARTPAFRIRPEDVIAAAPEVLLVAPCGYSAAHARDEYATLDLPEKWSDIPAVRKGRVYALEANSYFSRPGPRLVTGIQMLAKALYPQLEINPALDSAILPVLAPQSPLVPADTGSFAAAPGSTRAADSEAAAPATSKSTRAASA